METLVADSEDKAVEDIVFLLRRLNGELDDLIDLVGNFLIEHHGRENTKVSRKKDKKRSI